MRSRRLAAIVLVALGALISSDSAVAKPGDLDGSFSENGFAEIADNDSPASIAVAPDGSTVVVGRQYPAGGADGSSLVWVSRLKLDGTADETFGEGGSVVFDLSNGQPGSRSQATSVDVGGDGSLLVGGVVLGPSSTNQSFVLRLLPDGRPDAAFGTDGVVRFDPVAFAGSTEVALQGSRSLATASGQLVALRPDGNPDPSFANGGAATVPANGKLAVANDGSIVVAAATLDNSLAVTRLTQDGQPDQSFGQGGTVTFRDGPPPSAEQAEESVRSLAVGAEGEIIFSTRSCTHATTGPGGSLGECQSKAQRVAGSGEILGPLLATPVGEALAMDDSGRVLIGGSAGEPDGAIALSRSTFVGEHDLGFGNAGIALAHYGLQNGFITTLASGTANGRATALVQVDDLHMKVARFHLGAGPGDADADRVLDQSDRCDLYFATAPSGCPRVPRGVHLRHRAHAFFGDISSPLAGCETNARVSVFRKTAGPDELVARTRTDRRYGLFELGRSDSPAGVYYAQVHRHLKSGWGRCAGDRSASRVVSRSSR
jgi:uncharacterized delta-60 repeat protein